MVAPQPQEAQPASQQPAEAQPLSQQPFEAQPFEAQPQPLSQPQAGSQQEVQQDFFLQLKSFDSKPPQHFFFLQQDEVSHPQDGAAHPLSQQPLSQPQEASQQPLEAHPLSQQPLSQPQEGSPQQPFEAQPLSQPQAGSQQELLQHLRAFRRAKRPHFFFLQQQDEVSHPQDGAAHPLPQQPSSQPQEASQHPLEAQPLSQQLSHPVSQPQLGAAQQLGAGSQHPLLPSIRLSKSCPKPCWAHRPMPSTIVLAKMFHFIEPHLLYVELLR